MLWVVETWVQGFGWEYNFAYRSREHSRRHARNRRLLWGERTRILKYVRAA